jgi:S-adenosylmethionine:tRNA ribosyltransferase-isomerase
MRKVSIAPINYEDYLYELAEERIAKHPLEQRDASKLLVYKQGEIRHQTFRQIESVLPENAHLVFNNTKVIPARLYFQKKTGAIIEVFLLHPEAPSRVISQAMTQTSFGVWSVMIGNLRKWKDGDVLERELEVRGQKVVLKAKLQDRENKLIRFEWENPEVRFVDLIEAAGEVPLPPYMNRKPGEEDKPRYQTVYSQKEGAVAAPTAGLHFTNEVIESIKAKGITTDYLTLHVSAGTFQPIKEKNVIEHPMHSEQIEVSRQNIEKLLDPERKIFAVGTTSMRTMESLYWFGVKLLKGEEKIFKIDKLMPYAFKEEELPTRQQSMQAILDFMEEQQINELLGETEIFIFPGYTFRMCEGLVTNFHQPGSTLILLVAAFVGEDWRKIYQQALENDYRFLSYGDSSVLFRS